MCSPAHMRASVLCKIKLKTVTMRGVNMYCIFMPLSSHNDFGLYTFLSKKFIDKLIAVNNVN